MAVSTRWYPKGQQHFINGDVDWDAAQAINIALLATSFTFDDTDEFFQTHIQTPGDEYGSATGYTADGEAITTRTITTVDSSTLTARANSTTYAVGDMVRTGTDSGRVWLCIVGGTSAASEPTDMAGVNGTFLTSVTDNTVTWVNVGRAYIRLDGDAVSWTGLDQTATPGAVIFVDGATPGTDDYLLGHIDFGASETPTDLTITPPTEGWLALGAGDVIG